MAGAKSPSSAADHAMFYPLDDTQADIARDALQNFALLACPEKKNAKGICKIIRASKAMQRLLEYDGVKKKMPSMLGQFFGSATAKSTLKKLEVAVEKRTSFREEILCVTGGDHTFWSDVSLEPVRVDPSNPSSSVICFALFIRDTDEVRNKQRRREHDAEYLEDMEYDHELQRRVVNGALVNTMIIEPAAKGRSFVMSPHGIGAGIQKLTSYPSDALASEPMDKLYGPGTPPADRDMLERALQEHEPLSCDILCYKKDGTPWWRHVLAVPITGGGFVTFNIDVTVPVRFVGPYQVGVQFGRGSFGTVKAGRHTVTKRKVALKRMKVIDARAKKCIEQEIRIQRQLDSPMVAELIEVHTETNCVYLVMQLCAGGSLYDSVVRAGAVSEDRSRFYIRQATEAVAFCHSVGIVHRDLKPENFMLDDNGKKVVLIDFGLADAFKPGQKLTEVCGSKRFQAPEMLRRAAGGSKMLGYEGPPVDVWSLAVILFEFVNGQIQIPKTFKGDTGDFIRERVVNGKKEPVFSTDLADLICKMLDPQPSSRITTDGVLSHSWMTAVK